MKFDQEAAKRAGSMGLKTGAAIGVVNAVKIVAGTGTHGVQFAIETDEGAKAQYMNVYYKKADGSYIESGKNTIIAMMGLLRLQEVPLDDLPHEAPIREFTNVRLGLVLQKVHYTKNDQSDGYKFDIRLPFSAQTRKTYTEAIENKSASFVDAYCESLEDKDERVTHMPTQAQREANGGWGTGQQQIQPQYNEPPMDFDDDIPF